jgi:uncharacterized protein (DUF433 family)
MRRSSVGHIEASPDVCSGKPRIAGTRIRVQDVVAWTELGRSPDEIVDGYPHITLGDVYAALAYYHDHRDEIDRQIKEDEEFVAQFRAKSLARTTGKDADADPLSP